MYKKVTTPLKEIELCDLKAGDRVLISGIIYAARDAAHKRLCDALDCGQDLPIDLKGQIIYYAGPCPPKPGHISGPFGPTTSGRMDKYTPRMLEQGLKGMIGKGERSKDVIEAMQNAKAVYFAAIGGAGALLATKIKQQKTIAYEDLGAEAITKLLVEDFPAIVAIDYIGNSLFETEPPKYENKYAAIIQNTNKV